MKPLLQLTSLALALVLMTPAPASAFFFSNWFYPYSTRTTSVARTTATAPKVSALTSSAAAPPATFGTLSTGSSTSTSYSSMEQILLRLANQERLQHGLSSLQSDGALTSAAQTKSRDMVTKGYFSHTSPTYGTPAQMLTRFGVTHRQYAENLAKGADAYRIHAQWMASAGHRANILNPGMTHVGIGATPDGSGYAATQLFIAR